jgi:hypothetical protein
MSKTLSAACLSGLLLLGGSLLVPEPVLAQDLELQIGPDGVRPRFVDPDDDQYQYSRRRGRCDPDVAADIAREEGLRRVRIVDVTERRVVVRGRTPDGRVTMVFANRRGCPIIG